MFNPEMMKKYGEVGVKVQELQVELAGTEIECATNEGGIVVKVSGTQADSPPRAPSITPSLPPSLPNFPASQVPVSVTVSDDMCALGAEKLSAEIGSALAQE